VIADLADLQALLRACMALRDSHKALINVNLTSGKSYSQAAADGDVQACAAEADNGHSTTSRRAFHGPRPHTYRVRTFRRRSQGVVSAQSNAWRRFRDLLAAFLLFAYWKR
jgi:hypothetical protein